MIIEYEGKQYPYDPDDLDVEQALKIEKHIDGPMLEYEKGLAVGSAKCLQALGWLILHGGDLATPISGVNFKFKKLSDAFFAASEKAQAEEEAEAGPTVAASNGRKSARASSPSA